jgi:hypothetical protein
MPIGADVWSFIQRNGDAIDGLETYQKQEKTECQFTVKLLNSKIYQLHLKFYSQVLK